MGTTFVAQCKPGAGPYRIIEFEFNDSQTFVLELGDAYMRFHTLGAQILDSANVKTITGATAANPVVITSAGHGLSNGDEVYIAGVVGMTELNGRNFIIQNVTANTFELLDLNSAAVDGTGYTAYSSGGTATPPYEITTPWAAADLFAINYAQSGDIMTLVHPDYTAQELTRIANDDWTLTGLTFVPDLLGPDNMTADVNTTITTGTITAITQANPAQVTSAGHGLSTGDRIRITAVVGMVEINNFIYEIVRVDANNFTLKYQFDDSNVNSTGFTAYGSLGTWEKAIRPRLYTVTAVADDDEEESFRGRSSRDITITAISQADPCVVTTAAGHGLEPYDDIYIDGIVGMTELNGERFEAVFVSATQFSLQRLDGTPVDSTGFTAYSSGGIAHPLHIRAVSSADADWDNTISWDAVTGASYYNIYATDNFGVFGFIGRTTKTSFEDINLGPDYTNTVPLPFSPFDSFGGNGTDRQPGATGFFGQRRWFANSNNFPNRFWASQIGHFNNLNRSIPPLDDDSIVASIAARRINTIKHIVPLTELIFLTSGGEYRVQGGQDGTITPTTINVSPQSYYGCTDVRPIVAGDVGLFVSPGEFVRDLGYRVESNKFVGKDVTLLARHLFDYRSIVDWDFAPAPYALGFCVMSDGGGLFLTYQPDQDVYAWTRASTQGKYKSVCSIREGTDDILYTVVERKINGFTVSFIERFDERDFEELSDAFHVDAGLTLDVPITITGITAADPVVVTAPSHGLQNGDYVDISDVMEVDTSVNEQESLSADYNGTGFEVVNVTANTFELQIEGTDYDGSAFAAYSSGGVARKAVTTVSGLWHLEGATVVAAANGYSNQSLTVTNGSVTLNNRASRIHIGLGYFCRMISLPLTKYADGQTTDGRAKNVSRLTVQVERTMGMWFGPSIDNVREAKFGLPSLYGQPLELVTEDIDVTMRADWGKRKQVVIEQRDPLPLTVLTMIPDTIIGGN